LSDRPRLLGKVYHIIDRQGLSSIHSVEGSRARFFNRLSILIIEVDADEATAPSQALHAERRSATAAINPPAPAPAMAPAIAPVPTLVVQLEKKE